MVSRIDLAPLGEVLLLKLTGGRRHLMKAAGGSTRLRCAQVAGILVSEGLPNAEVNI